MNKKLIDNITKLGITAGTLAGTNAIIDHLAMSKGYNNKRKGEIFNFRHGDIFYTVQGQGEPVLLIHNLHQDDSSYEWKRIIPRLKENNTVYAVDLLGCGKSDKPNITYTNFMYVQLILSFIKTVIKNKTDIIVTGESVPFAIMAKKMEPDYIDKIIAINPADMQKQLLLPNSKTKLMAALLTTPIVGRFIYNMINRRIQTDYNFKDKYFFNMSYISNELKEIFYETAHIDQSKGRFLLASIISRYTYFDIRKAVKEIKDFYIIASRNSYHSSFIAAGYTNLNPEIEICSLSSVKLLPQLENPDKTYEAIMRFL